MRREGLRLRLALAIGQSLKVGRGISVDLAKKQISRDLLTLYSIRKDTEIYPSDWHIACMLALEERSSRLTDNISIGTAPTLTRMKIIFDRFSLGSLLRLTP